MVIKRLLISLMAIIFLVPVADSQLWRLHRLEVSGGIGTTQFYGDIGGYSNDENILGIRDFTFLHTRYNINANIRYRISQDVSIRLNLAGGLFHSTDKKGSNVKRGFEESTVFLEPSLIGEYYFIKNKRENSFLYLKGKRSIFKSIFGALDFCAYTGFGGLKYNVTPNSKLAADTVRTSGFTGVVPLGLGVTMIYNSKFSFGIEFGARLTFSDYIDGYTSSRSIANDIYHFVNFTVTYKVKTRK